MKGFGCIRISDIECRSCRSWIRNYDCKNARNILREERNIFNETYIDASQLKVTESGNIIFKENK